MFNFIAKRNKSKIIGGLIELPEVAENFRKDFQYFVKLLLMADDSIKFHLSLISYFDQMIILLFSVVSPQNKSKCII